MRRIPAREITLDPGGFGDEDLRGRVPVQGRDLDISGPEARLTAHGDHDVVALSERGTQVGVIEVGDEHQATP